MTIRWEKFNIGKTGRHAWVGEILARPLYVIKNVAPEAPDHFALVDLVSGIVLAEASGAGALGELQRRADQHRADLTGGLFP